MNFYVNRVRFEKRKTYARLLRAQGLALADALKLFHHPENRAYIEEHYENLSPYTVREALKLKNAEQRMAALTLLDMETVIREVGAVKLDKQVLEKKQIRWDENGEPYHHVFRDSYELFTMKIKKKETPGVWDFDTDVYFVKCVCPSTDRKYYLYVPPHVGEEKDALGAVAWTMRFNGNPLSKEEYVRFMYSET